jgi:hypothetical protein
VPIFFRVPIFVGPATFSRPALGGGASDRGVVGGCVGGGGVVAGLGGVLAAGASPGLFKSEKEFLDSIGGCANMGGRKCGI